MENVIQEKKFKEFENLFNRGKLAFKLYETMAKLNLNTIKQYNGSNTQKKRINLQKTSSIFFKNLINNYLTKMNSLGNVGIEYKRNLESFKEQFSDFSNSHQNNLEDLEQFLKSN